jgi:hypothetical protein
MDKQIELEMEEHIENYVNRNIEKQSSKVKDFSFLPTKPSPSVHSFATCIIACGTQWKCVMCQFDFREACLSNALFFTTRMCIYLKITHLVNIIEIEPSTGKKGKQTERMNFNRSAKYEKRRYTGQQSIPIQLEQNK